METQLSHNYLAFELKKVWTNSPLKIFFKKKKKKERERTNWSFLSCYLLDILGPNQKKTSYETDIWHNLPIFGESQTSLRLKYCEDHFHNQNASKTMAQLCII